MVQNGSDVVQASPDKPGVPSNTLEGLKALVKSSPTGKDACQALTSCMLGETFLEEVPDEELLASFQGISTYLKAIKINKSDWPKPLADKMDRLSKDVAKASNFAFVVLHPFMCFCFPAHFLISPLSCLLEIVS